MVYLAEVTTPPAIYTAAAPMLTKLAVTKGLVYKFHLYAPHGAMGLHYVQVFDGSYQLWPSSPGKAFRGDGIQIDWDDIYLKSVEPYEFTIKSWNLDDTYEHLTVIAVGMVSEEAFMARFLPSMSWENAVKAMADIQARQIEQQQAIIAQPFAWLPPSSEIGEE